MSDRTVISWTDATWNPVTGCSKVSQGCAHCYAERVFPRAYGRERAPSTEIFQYLSRHTRIHMRVLTTIECERLQGFPDQWTLPDTTPSATPLSRKSQSGSGDGS